MGFCFAQCTSTFYKSFTEFSYRALAPLVNLFSDLILSTLIYVSFVSSDIQWANACLWIHIWEPAGTGLRGGGGAWATESVSLDLRAGS